MEDIPNIFITQKECRSKKNIFFNNFRVFAVCWSIEDHYILSGSEDTNIRIWKDDPSRKIGPIGLREKRKTLYRQKLMQKFKYNQEVKKLKREHMPKYIYNSRKKKQVMNESKYRKMENMEFNNPNDLKFFKKEKVSKIVKTLE